MKANDGKKAAGGRKRQVLKGQLMTRATTKGFAAVNGASLYYERQGSGPPVLFIAGSTGDAGNFSRTADLLADEFTVVTYDRRGNSRSVRPPGWTATSVAEQADDAAALIQKLDIAPVAVFGASAGGPITLDLMLRHRELVSAGIIQEPSIFSLLPDPTAALAPRRAIIEEALKTKGARGAVEALMRYLNDDSVGTVIPTDILERMLGNADTILTIEGPGFADWRLPIEDLKGLGILIVLLVASDTLPAYKEITRLLAEQLGIEPITVPGQHAFYYYRPQILANVLRPLLRRLP
jgi:pimeloyl-ACP methyl ester carboxylesterase